MRRIITALAALLLASSLAFGQGDVINPQTNASALTTGTLPAARMPALTGPVTTSAGAVATTVVFPPVSGLRLTNSTAVPVLTTSVPGATSHFCTPYTSQWVPIYNGSSFVLVDVGGELTQTMVDNTKSPAAVANTSVYDVFVWLDSGTARCTRGPAWTNDTTRGYTLTRQNGVLLNTSSITNGPAALRGTYIGTFRSNGTATLDFLFGASNQAASLFIWNYYNRVDVKTTAFDSTVSWTYSSATVRAARAQTTTRINWVSGLAEDGVCGVYDSLITLAGALNASAQIGIALDSTTAQDKLRDPNNTVAVAEATAISVRNCYPPQLGVHFLSGNEAGDGTNTTTFFGAQRQGLSFEMRM